MQDLTTGKIHPLLVDDVPTIPQEKLVSALYGRDLEAAQADLKKEFQAEADKVIPEKANQGPILVVGAIIKIGSGRFRVSAIRERKVVLRSLSA